MDSLIEDDGTARKKMDNTSNYVRTVIALHNIRDRTKEAVESLQEKSIAERVHETWNKTRQAVFSRTRNFFAHPDNVQCEHIPQKYSYIFRPKSRWELILLSGTVCGIEFCYAAETAFVTPILLSLGVNIKFATMIWCLSPFIGFFLTPLLGSLSDSCESRFGRRRPFILLLSVGILLGLILVPNGHNIGIALGDTRNLIPEDSGFSNETNVSNTTTEGSGEYFSENANQLDLIYASRQKFSNMAVPNVHMKNTSSVLFSNVSQVVNETLYVNIEKRFARKGNTQSAVKSPSRNTTGNHVQPWSIVFTVIGTVLLDFCSDACQSPSRTYLLDVSRHEDHNAGLSTFTLMAGLGGSVGYLMGAVHWESTFWGDLLGGQVNAVFTLVSIIFVICLILTLSSFPEIPLPILKDPKVFREYQQKLQVGEFQEKGNELDVIDSKGSNYGTTSTKGVSEDAIESIPNGKLNGISEIAETISEIAETKISEITERNSAEADGISNESTIEIEQKALEANNDQPVLKEYLRSIIHMPKSLQILCLTNLFCWMSLVCYSLYFTDFVGEVVYGGDPKAPEGSYLQKLFNDGVSFGCWGMALYSISCSVYSYFIEALVKRLGAKPVYIGGQLVYTVGMIIMAVARHPVAVILLSPTAGIMYSTLFTMPYLLIAHYHCMQKFRDDKSGGECGIRGIGTDVATVSSMVFLSQFILSLTMGSIVEAVGSNVVTVCAAAILSACGAASATQVMYLDM